MMITKEASGLTYGDSLIPMWPPYWNTCAFTISGTHTKQFFLMASSCMYLCVHTWIQTCLGDTIICVCVLLCMCA